jgi:hypothetical protein
MTVRTAVAVGLLAAGLLLGGAGYSRPDLEAEIADRDLAGAGVELGVLVVIEGEGVVLSRFPETPRAAASAIKTAIAVDLLHVRGDLLDTVPSGVDPLLRPGTHPAFRGFTPEELSHARGHLVGRTYRELARIMMGRTEAGNAVYNAACNLIMIKLGGPRTIRNRVQGLDPALQGLDVNRYMQSWNGDGDNRATPGALVALYRMTAEGQVPGLAPDAVETLRSWLRRDDAGRPGTLYEKIGTLYPDPMVRVHAGYVHRDSETLVYAVMGEIPRTDDEGAADRFVRLMNAVDSVTAACLRMAGP